AAAESDVEAPAMMDSFSPEDLDSYSSEDLDDDDDDDEDGDGEMQDAFDVWGTTQEPEPEPEPVVSEDLLQLADVEVSSFRALRDARALVFESKVNLEAFTNQVAALGETGEEGRRRGLGAWVLGDYQSSSNLLASFESDPVASFTRAKALMSVANYSEAQNVYTRLASEYPDLAPPRAGLIEARLQATLASGDEEAAIELLVTALGEAPLEFAESPEGQYLTGRRFELAQEFETALDHYKASMDADSSIRENLFHGGHLAERCGLDSLALEFYETLSRQLPVDSNVLMNLGVLYEDMGRDQDAAACYDIVQKAKPTESRPRMYLNDAIAAMDMYYDEDRERKEDRLNQILRIPITDFELSVRARNCLNKMDINVLGDLVRRTEQELLSFKNFGETSLTEIKEILHSKGLRLGMPRDEAVASVEVHSTRTYTGEKADIYNKPISHLQLSIRARRTVEALGCLTIGDVMKHSSDELLGMPNFGVTSLQELKSALSQISLKLRGE
ncbi:MAG: DNA-directed RNA polymerase subunit alpha, partial [Planctomycetota bacterium]